MAIKKIIITGGSGFLGRHLGRALMAEGYEVKGIDVRPNDVYESIEADVQDASAMMEHIKDADLIFHLAGYIEAGESVKFPQKFVDNNIDGTITILEAMKANGIKNIVFSSSAAVYGEPIKTPIQEDDRTIPINPYGMTKLAMEGLISSYVQSFKMSGVALRYFNLYGPEEHHQPETHAIPRFIDQIKNGSEVTVYGDGMYGRDYIYIDDVVAAHIKCIELLEKEPEVYHYFNLSTEKAADVLEIADALGKIMGKEPNLKMMPPRPGDPRLLVADASKAKEKLGWQAQVSLEDGLKKTVEYFSK